MSKNKITNPPHTSALLMLSPQEVGLFGVSEGNMPSLLAVPSADDKLMINGQNIYIIYFFLIC